MDRRVTHSRVSAGLPFLCKECGCVCKKCNSSSLDLHQEIEELQSHLMRSNTHISQIEHELLDSKQIADWEVLKVTDEFAKLRDRYDRLLESHKRMQRVNHELEDKLLKVVNKFESEKIDLQQELAKSTSKLVDAKLTICDLEDENERYRVDCNMAVQLLQCKPSNFIAHKLDCLPVDLQDRVKKHLSIEQKINMENTSTKESRLIRVPIATFPPTAMVYSVNNFQNKNDVENGMDKPVYGETVPMTLIAKVLTKPEPIYKPQRTYICWKCKKDVVNVDKETQVNTFNYKDTDNNSSRIRRPSGVHRSRLDSTETEI